MGNEFAQFAEWSEERSLDWHLLEYEKHALMQAYGRATSIICTVNSRRSLASSTFEPDGFRWIEANDADYSVYSYIRYAEEDGTTFWWSR